MVGMTMSDEHPAADAVVVKRFWHNYLSILEKARISKCGGSMVPQTCRGVHTGPQGTPIGDAFTQSDRLTI